MPGPSRSPRPSARGRARAGTSPGSPGRGARSGPERSRRPAAAVPPVAPAAPSAAAAARRRSSLTGRAAILALVLAALVVSYASSLRAWAEQRSQIAALKAEQTERILRVGELEREIDRWNDPAYIEAQARSRLGWVFPGETGYKIVDESGKPVTPPVSASSSKSTKTPWWSTLWGSVEKAGNPPAPAAEPKKPKPAATIDPGPSDQ